MCGIFSCSVSRAEMIFRRRAGAVTTICCGACGVGWRSICEIPASGNGNTRFPLRAARRRKIRCTVFFARKRLRQKICFCIFCSSVFWPRDRFRRPIFGRSFRKRIPRRRFRIHRRCEKMRGVCKSGGARKLNPDGACCMSFRNRCRRRMRWMTFEFSKPMSAIRSK